MTATNIDIEKFINVLNEIYSTGVRIINLDMIPDDTHPSMNKLIIHPIKEVSGDGDSTNRVIVRNPRINPDSDDIFNALNNI